MAGIRNEINCSMPLANFMVHNNGQPKTLGLKFFSFDGSGSKNTTEGWEWERNRPSRHQVGEEENEFLSIFVESFSQHGSLSSNLTTTSVLSTTLVLLDDRPKVELSWRKTRRGGNFLVFSFLIVYLPYKLVFFSTSLPPDVMTWNLYSCLLRWQSGVTLRLWGELNMEFQTNVYYSDIDRIEIWINTKK